MSAKTRHYNPICEDSNDSKIPLHNDDAFQQGIQFQVKVRSITILTLHGLTLVFSSSGHWKSQNPQVGLKSLPPCDAYV